MNNLSVRKLLTFVVFMFITCSLLAGGLVTNTNHSAMFTRLQNRNASTGIDAVYYNPAGLSKLGPGFFASINNQTIEQTQKVISDYLYITGAPKEYMGKVSAPIFSAIYLVYNTGKLSFSAGFNPIGGGGGAEYKKGLPSFEMSIADIVPGLSSQGIPTTQYSSDIYFEGSSVYLGYQANIVYKINDMLSVAAGVRMVTASNKYKGYLKNISINPTCPAFGASYTGAMVLASEFFTAGATTLSTLAAGANDYVTGLQPIVDAGAGATPLSSGTTVGLSTAQVGQIQQLLVAAGLTPAQMDAVTIAGAQGALSLAAPAFTSKANTMTGNAAGTQDINVDATESGTGFTSILSANISPSEKLDIAVKYEFRTEIDLKTKVGNNLGGGIFVDGKKIVGDMPAMLSLGVDYKPIKKLLVSAAMNTYFDKGVDYDGDETVNINEIDKNFIEFGLGLEYGLTEKLCLSAGWTHTTTGVNLNYQSDQSFSTNTNSFGTGFGYHITPMIDLNLGCQYTFYNEGSKTYDHMPSTNPISVTETYNKSTWIVALGLDFYFGKEAKVKEPRSVLKAKKQQEANDKKLKKDYEKSIRQSQKRTIDIQTPEVQARMKQNKKDSAVRDKAKKKKVKTGTKKAAKKYN
jgi:long-subunit fatty acid transport protein